MTVCRWHRHSESTFRVAAGDDFGSNLFSSLARPTETASFKMIWYLAVISPARP